MEGGTSLVFRRARVFSFGKFIPLAWWVPQKERALLAVVASGFWGATIMQALQKDAGGASVLAFYGLGLVYTVCVIANIGGGARVSLIGYKRRWKQSEQARALVQMFGIMMGMLVCNALVLSVYLQKGAAVTPLDIACGVVAAAAFLLLFGRYGWKGAFKHPVSRGYMAAACKAFPQTLLGGLFFVQPAVASAFTFWALGSLAVLGGLRFWPSILAFRRDRSSKHMQGLMLSETANMASICLMCVAWLLA